MAPKNTHFGRLGGHKDADDVEVESCLNGRSETEITSSD